MSEDQAAQMIAYMYSSNERLDAVGTIAGQATNWLQIVAILLCGVLFFLALRRS